VRQKKRSLHFFISASLNASAQLSSASSASSAAWRRMAADESAPRCALNLASPVPVRTRARRRYDYRA
jgi:hypothetical protein